MLVCAFGNGAGSAADQAFDVSAALRALVDGIVRHFLAFLKVAGTFIAEIFVGRQNFLLRTILGSQAIFGPARMHYSTAVSAE